MWAYCNFMRLSFCKADKERHLHLDKETFLNLEPLLGIAINLREETQYFFLKISISTPDTTEKKCLTFPSPMSWEHHSINAIEKIQGVEIGGVSKEVYNDNKKRFGNRGGIKQMIDDNKKCTRRCIE